MSTPSPLHGQYDLRLVALSVSIAILAAYAALDLAGRVRLGDRKMRMPWLLGGAAAMGIGIWSMHFVGMEALQHVVPMRYDWPTVLLSLLAAILASAAALTIASRDAMGGSAILGGSLAMGLGIATMHYAGMDAMRMPARIVYSPWLVALSIVLAIGISYLALKLAFALKRTGSPQDWRKPGSAVLMGLAIPTMHYVGMAAATFVPDASMRSLAHAVNLSTLSLTGIVSSSLGLLAFVFAISSMDRSLQMQSGEIAESRAQLQTILDNMTEAIIAVDVTGVVREYNRAARNLFGIGAGDSSTAPALRTSAVMYDSFTMDGTPIDIEDHPGAQALRGIYCVNRRMRLQHKGSSRMMDVEVTTVPIASSEAAAPGVLITWRDITDRREKDEALRWLAAIVNSSEDAIVGKNDKGVVTSWNHGAEKVFGYTAEEMIGQSILRLLPEDRLQEEEEIQDRLRRGETVDHFETVRLRKNGETIFVSLTISPIRNGDGKLIGASKIARDITEQMRLEGQMQQSQKMEALGNLTGGIAHDFNNLLGVIVGNLDLLERWAQKDEAALKRVKTAQKASARGADLTRRLLGFSSNGGLKPIALGLDQSIRNAVELAERGVGPEIRIVTHFNDGDAEVLADVGSLESALINLMVNARDAMPKGGTITIATDVSELEETYPPVMTGELKAGTYIRVSVTDMGTGMSRETLEHALEPYFTTKPRGKGTGLGLAMVYGFVKQSGGTVRLYSEPGYGTTVTLYLPPMQAIREAAPDLVAQLPGTKLSGKVMLVDDEQDLLEIAGIYLEEMGYSAVQAKDGASALEAIQQRRDFGLLVTDIVMPGGLNGVELAREAKRAIPGIRVIFCSGFQADALQERNLATLEGPLLQKPYQRTEFERAVRAVMEG